jgi:hypothetical protein
MILTCILMTRFESDQSLDASLRLWEPPMETSHMLRTSVTR